MKNITLVIMAAGIGSCFGGSIKQLEPVGPNGEIIMDYSIHDALVSNQLRVPSKTKPRIVAGFKTSCNGLDIFLEFQASREAVHPESLNLCHSYVGEFR